MLRRKGLRREKRMPYIQMNCKNCGAPLERQGDSFVCGHCGSRVFRILDAKIEAGQDILSREEFEKALQEQKNTAGADLGDGLRRFDAGSELLNAQLKQASVLLHDGKPYAVEEALEGVPDTIFAAERLRLLAQTGAKDEQSLSMWAGDLRSSEHFERVMALADFEQKRVYEHIAAVCEENKKIADEIAQGNKLMKAQAYEDAERYAAVMCGFYPAKSRAWELLIAARCAKDKNYDPARDLEFFMRCPDFEMTYGRPLDGVLPQNVSPIIRDRVRETERKKQKSAAFWKKAVTSAITLAGLAVLALVWAFLEKLFS